MASIKWAFKPTKKFKERIFFWKRQGGHLALLTGYDQDGLYVHHTSTRAEYNWENKHISWKQFDDGFTGRGIVIGG